MKSYVNTFHSPARTRQIIIEQADLRVAFDLSKIYYTQLGVLDINVRRQLQSEMINTAAYSLLYT